jgi:hypothetical protein
MRLLRVETSQSHLEIIHPDALKFGEIVLAEATTQNGIGILGSGQDHERLVIDVVSSSRLLRADPEAGVAPAGSPAPFHGAPFRQLRVSSLCFADPPLSTSQKLRAR